MFTIPNLVLVLALLAPQPEAAWPPRTTVADLDAMVKAGNYHLIRKQKVAHQIEASGVVRGLGTPDWVLVNLPGTWAGHLRGLTADHGLKPGDRVKFRALILDEAYEGLLLWNCSWNKEPDQKVPAQEPGKLRQVLAVKETYDVPYLAVSPDGKRVYASDRWFALGDPSKHVPKLTAWDLTTGKELFTIEGSTGMGSVPFTVSPDGDWLVISNHDDGVRTLKLWDARTGKPLRTLGEHTEGSASHLAFSPDGKYLVTGGYKRENPESAAFDARWSAVLLVWDVKEGKPVRSLSGAGHTRGVGDVAVSPDGKHFASASEDWTVIVWELATGRKVHTLKGHTDQAHCVAFSPDGKHLASGGQDGKVILWDTRNGKRVRTLDAGILTFHNRVWTRTIYSVAFIPDGKYLATGGMDGGVRLWDAGTGRLVAVGDEGHSRRSTGVVTITPDGRIVSGSESRGIEVWELPK